MLDKIFLSGSLLFCAAVHAVAQDSFRQDTDSLVLPDEPPVLRMVPIQNTLTPSTPPSPQAEAFQRVGEYSVNNAYGMPDISIPLFEIDHHGYKIPLTLRYFATPVRPGYNYDVTGFGWSLSSGYCISRTINSIADEKNDFKLNSSMLNGYYQLFKDNFNNYNYQFDLFQAVLPNGLTFHFYMYKPDGSGTIQYVVSTKKQIQISCQFNTGSIVSFTVIDDSGVKYFFDIAETATDSQNRTSNITWYLSRIELPHSSQPIKFYYNASILQQHVQGLEEPIVTLTHDHPNTYPPDMVYVTRTMSDSKSYYRTKLLTRIEYGLSSINFQYLYGNSEQEFNYLSKISVSGLKEYRLSYNMTTVGNYTIARLNRLVVAGVTTPCDSLVYKFGYQSFGPFSGTDHWGYYSNFTSSDKNVANMNFYCEVPTMFNSNIANTHLLTVLGSDPSGWCPYQKYKLLGDSSYYEVRRSLPPTSHGVLSSITYPTGGKTVFVFENHRFVTATDANGDYVATKRLRRVIEGGGFRIKTITNYTSDNRVADIRQFRYGPTYKEANQQNLNLPGITGNTTDQHIGFGEPVVDPNILTYSRFSSCDGFPTFIKFMLLGLDPAGNHTNFATPFDQLYYNYKPWRFDCQFSPVFFRSLLRGRHAVIYPEITEYHGDVGYMEQTPGNTIGKTVYKFDIYENPGDSVCCNPVEYYGNTLDYTQHTAQKLFPVEKSYYGYEGFFKILRKETFSYTSTGSSYHDYVYKNTYSPGCESNSMYMSSLMQSRYLYADSYLLTEHVTTDYTNNGNVTVTETNSYNTHDQVVSSTFTGAKPHSSTYTYPGMTSPVSAIEQQMMQANIMSPVLLSRTYAQGMSAYSVSGQRIDYAEYTMDNGSTRLLPSSLSRLSVINGTAGNFEEEMQVVSYSSNGNPQEVIDRSGMHTVYLWSYNDNYLVAEIKNATLSQVASVLGISVEQLASASSPSPATLSGLHSNTALSDAMVTTWTYLPMVGITSQTDPSGMATYYSYDSLGRLKEVYRYEGNAVSPSNKRILKQYTYHTITN